MMRIAKKFGAWKYKHFLLGSFFGVIGFFSLLVLVSFCPYDLSWAYHSSEAGPIVNLFGSFGAQIAAFFFYMFGFFSLAFVWLFFYCSYFCFFKKSLKNEWDRFVAYLFLPISGSALFYWYQFDFFAVSPGGVVGLSVCKTVTKWFDPIGGAVLVHLFFFICVIVIFRTTFVRALHLLSRAVQFLCDKEKFLHPAYVVFKKIGKAVAAPFVWAARSLCRLFDGKDITQSGESIVSFEQQLVDEVEQGDFQEDPFWRDFTGKSVDSDAQKISKKALCKKESSKTPLDLSAAHRQYSLPDKNIFKNPDSVDDDKKTMTELEQRAKTLEEKLERFGVYGSVVSIKCGPVVTLFEYEPQIDSKISKIIALEDDLALALEALSIRIIAPIPGKSVVGFEVANIKRKNVLLASLIHSESFKKFKGSIPLVLGKDTIGREAIVDLAKMPHLLIAGSTGSGKSVGLNAFLVSMLYKLTPDELKLILVDPKRLEFASYADIPHLLFPIVTDPKRTAPILRWVVGQMEKRYQNMSEVGARNIFDYNKYVALHKKSIASDGTVREKLPFIVIVIDELSDLMMSCGRDIEGLIARIAQMARAAGIHMIVATQRPSVDVITGLIKVNFPSRISFRVTSKVDSRTILDYCGAEKLLGSGDMLFLDSGSSLLKRLHGAYVCNEEIETLVNHIRAEQTVEYLDLSPELLKEELSLCSADDELYKNVVQFLEKIDEVSISLLQRKFRIGYNRSARIIDLLESRGIILPSDGGKMRKVIH